MRKKSLEERLVDARAEFKAEFNVFPTEVRISQDFDRALCVLLGPGSLFKKDIKLFGMLVEIDHDLPDDSVIPSAPGVCRMPTKECRLELKLVEIVDRLLFDNEAYRRAREGAEGVEMEELEDFATEVGRHVIQLRRQIPGELLETIEYPVNWWEAFKDRWFQRRGFWWILKRWPVRIKRVEIMAYYKRISLPDGNPIVRPTLAEVARRASGRVPPQRFRGYA